MAAPPRPTPVAPGLPVAARPSRFGALTDARYRRYWLGSLSSVSGSQLVVLGQGWVIVDTLGGSPLSLGIVGAATAIPTILLNLFGGVLADRMDRRWLLLATSTIQFLLLTAMMTLDATGAIQVWHVAVIAAGLGLVYGVDWPTRNAFFPLLIRREQMMSAVALNAMVWQGTRVVAPAVGGVLIALSGTPLVFGIAALGSLGMCVVLFTLSVPASPPTPRDVLRDLREGLSFIFQRRLFLALLGLTYAGMLFGMQYVQLMPLMAKEFGVESGRLGLMFTAAGAGAVCGTFVTMRLHRSERLGQLLMLGLLCAAVFVTLFAVSPTYLVGMVMLFFAAFSSSVFSITTMTALQLRTPDHLRGRVMGIHTITFSLIPLGGLLGGAIAEVSSVRLALAVSAIALAGVVLAIAATSKDVRALDGRSE